MTADSTQVTKEAIYNDVKGAIQEMAEALKVTADHVYGILVKQQPIQSIVYLMLYVAFVMAVWFCYKIGVKFSKDDNMESELQAAPWLMGIIIFGVGCLIFLFTIDNVVTGFVNPEYGAIENIIELVKK